MNFDFTTVADNIDYGFGTNWRDDFTMMAGAQLHVKTAPCIIRALVGLSESGLYGWTPSDEPKYIQAIVNWMHNVRHWEIASEWIVPSYGILQAMCACIRAFTQPGDGIIVQQPVYLLYSRAINNCGRELIDNTLLQDGDHFIIDFADLEKKMSNPRNKLMLLCNPHNPTMDTWDRATLERIAALAKKHHVLVVTDEIYAEHVWAPAICIPYSTIKDAEDNCVVCTSIGKSFNFTGTSHANIIIPNSDIRERYIAQRNADHYGSLSPFMRAAVLGAYSEEGKAWIDALLDFVTENERIIRDFFKEVLPAAKVMRHTAGTLIWVDFRAIGNEDTVAARFRAAGVEPDCGSKYGEPGRGFFRLQIGMPRSELLGALNRLRKEFSR